MAEKRSNNGSIGPSSIDVYREDEPRKLFIGGLTRNTTVETLRSYFGVFGRIVDAIVMTDQQGQSRGFGFVTYDETDAVERVLQQPVHFLDSKQVDVKRSVSKNMRPPPRQFDRSKKAFLGGLPTDMSETELKEVLSMYGKVTECTIMYDEKTLKSRGFGFVGFEEESTVERLLRQQYVPIRNKQVEVKPARPRNNPTGDTLSSMMIGPNAMGAAGGGYGGYHNGTGGMMNNSMGGGASSAGGYDQAAAYAAALMMMTSSGSAAGGGGGGSPLEGILSAAAAASAQQQQQQQKPKRPEQDPAAIASAAQAYAAAQAAAYGAYGAAAAQQQQQQSAMAAAAGSYGAQAGAADPYAAYYAAAAAAASQQQQYPYGYSNQNVAKPDSNAASSMASPYWPDYSSNPAALQQSYYSSYSNNTSSTNNNNNTGGGNYN